MVEQDKTKNKTKSRLHAVLDFTPDDLDANRAGVISERQRERLRQTGYLALFKRFVSRAVIVAVLGGVALFALNDGGTILAVLLPVIVVVVGVETALEWRPYRKVLRSGAVQQVQGVVRFQSTSGKFSMSIFEGRRRVFWMPVSGEVPAVLSTDDTYRFYYLTRLPVLLSVERVDSGE